MVPGVVAQFHSRTHPGFELLHARNRGRGHVPSGCVFREGRRIRDVTSPFTVGQRLERRHVLAARQQVSSPPAVDGGLDHLPPGGRTGVHEPRAHEHRRDHLAFAEQRESVVDNIGVTVVERDPHRTLRKRRSAARGGDDLGTAHRLVATHHEVELSAKRLRIGHPVIGNHPKPPAKHEFHCR